MYAAKLCSIKVLLIINLALLVLFIGVILLGFVGFPAIVDLELHKTVQLETGTIQWDRFKKLPINFDLKLYIFHVNNAADVHNNGALPNITERGPYYYKQTLERDISDVNNVDDSVTYTQIRKLYFDEDQSKDLKESDTVTIVNPVLLVITQMTSPLERLIVYGCLDKVLPANLMDFFIETDIGTLVLDGLTFAKETDLSGPSCNVVRNLLVERARRIKNVDVVYGVNGTVKELKFSILNFRQSGPDGVYTVNRGRDDISQLGSLMKWNGKHRFPYWGTPKSVHNETCNQVRGTDGTIYPPHASTTKGFEVFTSDICRVVSVNYNGKRKYKGMEGYLYSIGPETLRTSYSEPEKDCYCTKMTRDPTDTPSCFLDGVMDVMPCFNAPLLLSWPHFLYADDYRNGLIGLSEANPDIHKTFVLIEPNTGTPLEGAKRVQLNFVIRPIQFMPMTSKHPRTVLPLTWLEEGVGLTQELVDELESKYYGKLRMVRAVKYGLIAVFASFLCIGLVFLLRKRYCTPK